MKTINFINRTFEELRKSYLLLKTRYKTVRFTKILRNGYYYGYFEVSKSMVV